MSAFDDLIFCSFYFGEVNKSFGADRFQVLVEVANIFEWALSLLAHSQLLLLTTLHGILRALLEVYVELVRHLVNLFILALNVVFVFLLFDEHLLNVGGVFMEIVEVDVHAALEAKTPIMLDILHVHTIAYTVLKYAVDGDSKQYGRIRKAIFEICLGILSTP